MTLLLVREKLMRTSTWRSLRGCAWLSLTWGLGCPVGVGWVGPSWGVGPAGLRVCGLGKYLDSAGDLVHCGPQNPPYGETKRDSRVVSRAEQEFLSSAQTEPESPDWSTPSTEITDSTKQHNLSGKSIPEGKTRRNSPVVSWAEQEIMSSAPQKWIFLVGYVVVSYHQGFQCTIAE